MSKPKFTFAVTQEVIDNTPTELDGVRLTAEDFVPRQSNPTDTGWDCRCAIPGGIMIKPGCFFKMSLGFRTMPEPGWWYSLVPRSSTFIKLNVHALYGTIDQTYENVVAFVGQWQPDACSLIQADLFIPFGARIAQIIPHPIHDMEQVVVSNEKLNQMFSDRNGQRGTGGFGSSGRK